MQNEPLWRTVLCWGTVITFLTLPLVCFVLEVISEEEQVTWLHFNEHLKQFNWLVPYFQSITALVFGLAGLNSFDKSRNGKNERKNEVK